MGQIVEIVFLKGQFFCNLVDGIAAGNDSEFLFKCHAGY